MNFREVSAEEIGKFLASWESKPHRRRWRISVPVLSYERSVRPSCELPLHPGPPRPASRRRCPDRVKGKRRVTQGSPECEDDAVYVTRFRLRQRFHVAHDRCSALAASSALSPISLSANVAWHHRRSRRHIIVDGTARETGDSGGASPRRNRRFPQTTLHDRKSPFMTPVHAPRS